MNKDRRFLKVVSILAVAVLVLACSGGGAFVSATETPSATSTPVSTNTATPRPTSTPRPTKTPFPTPAPKGISIDTGDFSFTVVDAVSLRRIYPGGEYLFTPNPGYIILDVGVRLENGKSGEVVSIPWENVYIKEQNGDSWYPYWGSYKPVESGIEMDPFTVGISSNEIVGTERINFTGDAYLRLIFIVGDNNNQPVPLMFGIGDSPETELLVDQPK